MEAGEGRAGAAPGARPEPLKGRLARPGWGSAGVGSGIGVWTPRLRRPFPLCSGAVAQAGSRALGLEGALEAGLRGAGVLVALSFLQWPVEC